MKFLCLHGMGTNSRIFESQLSSTLSYLEAHGHEFIFVDGLIECSPAEEINSFFPGPYFCYYDLPTDDLIRQAQTYIGEVIEEEGPFDGVIGFSQGAALAASMMLEHAKTHPFEVIFKLAVFVGASLPFESSSKSKSMKRPITKREDSESSESSLNDELDPYTSWRIPKNYWEPLGPILGRYHPERTPSARIEQPTLHIIGEQDEYASQGQMLMKMCTGQTSVIHHREGHRIPRDEGFHGKAATAIERLISRVNLAC